LNFFSKKQINRGTRGLSQIVERIPGNRISNGNSKKMFNQLVYEDLPAMPPTSKFLPVEERDTKTEPNEVFFNNFFPIFE
jgi:hypothetical protein